MSALPSFVDPDILFYRKDIFQQKGLTPPKTLAEMESLAQKLHDPKNNLYGFVARGLKNANASPFAYIVFAMGRITSRRTGSPRSTRRPGFRALEYYTRMLRQYAPPGVVNFNWYECSSAFMQEQVAMYFDGVNFATQFEKSSAPEPNAAWSSDPGSPGAGGPGRFVLN